jgi:hypothetical protein
MQDNPMISTFTGLGYEPNDWGKLPLALRQRWWQETDYGKNEPSADLVSAIKTAMSPPTVIIAEEPMMPVTEQHRIDDEAAP